MKDGLLLTLISVAESESQIESDVTLLVGGFLVSGIVISAKKYMDHNPASRKFWDIVEKIPPKEDVDNSPNFIHLRDAKFYTSGGPPISQNAGVYWRGSLESIHGFNFGSLSAETH